MSDYGGWDGLWYKDVDYLNSEENLRENAAIIEDMHRRLLPDPVTRKKCGHFLHPLDKGEFEECLFPYKGAWYFINNGSSREQDDLWIRGPFSTEEAIHYIRQQRFLEERDPSLERDVTDSFQVPESSADQRCSVHQTSSLRRGPALSVRKRGRALGVRRFSVPLDSGRYALTAYAGVLGWTLYIRPESGAPYSVKIGPGDERACFQGLLDWYERESARPVRKKRRLLDEAELDAQIQSIFAQFLGEQEAQSQRDRILRLRLDDEENRGSLFFYQEGEQWRVRYCELGREEAELGEHGPFKAAECFRSVFEDSDWGRELDDVLEELFSEYEGEDGPFDHFVVSFLNYKWNRLANDQILRELRQLLRQDPAAEEACESLFEPRMDKHPCTEHIFPYRGAWYACSNGCEKEGKPSHVYGPFTSAQMLRYIRQRAGLEAKDRTPLRELKDLSGIVSYDARASVDPALL